MLAFFNNIQQILTNLYKEDRLFNTQWVITLVGVSLKSGAIKYNKIDGLQLAKKGMQNGQKQNHQ